MLIMNSRTFRSIVMRGLKSAENLLKGGAGRFLDTQMIALVVNCGGLCYAPIYSLIQ